MKRAVLYLYFVMKRAVLYLYLYLVIKRAYLFLYTCLAMKYLNNRHTSGLMSSLWPNVTEHRLIVDNKFRWQADIEHMQKHVKKTVSSFSTATYHQHRYQKTLLQRSHIISHRLCVSSVRWLWRGTLKKTELPTSKGTQNNPS